MFNHLRNVTVGLVSTAVPKEFLALRAEWVVSNSNMRGGGGGGEERQGREREGEKRETGGRKAGRRQREQKTTQNTDTPVTKSNTIYRSGLRIFCPPPPPPPSPILPVHSDWVPYRRRPRSNLGIHFLAVDVHVLYRYPVRLYPFPARKRILPIQIKAEKASCSLSPTKDRYEIKKT